jgi:hypothetical protein
MCKNEKFKSWFCIIGISRENTIFQINKYKIKKIFSHKIFLDFSSSLNFIINFFSNFFKFKKKKLLKYIFPHHLFMNKCDML